MRRSNTDGSLSRSPRGVGSHALSQRRAAGTSVRRTARGRASNRGDNAEDVVVTGRGLVPLDLGERVHEGDGPGLVVEAAALPDPRDAAAAGRAAGGLVG